MNINDLSATNLTVPPENYAAGEAELETIAHGIEQGEIVIDKLSLAGKRADFLNRHLEQQLLNVEQAVTQLGVPSNTASETRPS